MMAYPSAPGRAPLRSSQGNEGTDCAGNFQGVGLQREVSGIKKAHNRAWIVAFERLGTNREEERIVLAPYRQQRRLMAPETLVAGVGKCDVAVVISEEVELRVIGAGSGQVKGIERVAVGRNQRRVGYAVCVLPAGCLGREEGSERLSVRRRRVLPIGPNRTPAVAETFLVGVAVLGDDDCNP